MKGSEAFKKAIQAHLDSRAEADSLFAETLKKENKNIDDCITYILNEVQKSGVNGFEDSEIFGMAVHYYDEDEIAVGKANTGGRVVVNHVVEVTEEEKAEAKKKALDDLVEQAKNKIQNKKIVKTAKQTDTSKPTEQTSLF